nr:unnamed protein product [Naegleria fowleri]
MGNLQFSSSSSSLRKDVSNSSRRSSESAISYSSSIIQTRPKVQYSEKPSVQEEDDDESMVFKHISLLKEPRNKNFLKRSSPPPQHHQSHDLESSLPILRSKACMNNNNNSDHGSFDGNWRSSLHSTITRFGSLPSKFKTNNKTYPFMDEDEEKVIQKITLNHSHPRRKKNNTTIFLGSKEEKKKNETQIKISSSIVVPSLLRKEESSSSESSSDSEDEKEGIEKTNIERGILPHSREAFQWLFKNSEQLFDELDLGNSSRSRRKSDSGVGSNRSNDRCLNLSESSIHKHQSVPNFKPSLYHSPPRKRPFCPFRTPQSSMESAPLFNLGNDEIAIIVTSHPNNVILSNTEMDSTTLFKRKHVQRTSVKR